MHVYRIRGLDDTAASTEPWSLPTRTMLAELGGIDAFPPTGLITALDWILSNPRPPKGTLQFDAVGGKFCQRVGVDNVLTMRITKRIEPGGS